MAKSYRLLRAKMRPEAQAAAQTHAQAILQPFEDPQVPAHLSLHRENRHWVAFLAMGRAQKVYLQHRATTLPDLLRVLMRWVEQEQAMVQDGTMSDPMLFAEHAATLAVLQAEARAQGVQVHG